MKIDHLGYVTSNLNTTIKIFKDCLNLEPITKIIKEPAHKVKIIFFKFKGSNYPALEIITPTSRNSKVSNFLQKKGDGLHHIAYEVGDINKKISELEKKNFIVLSEIVPGAGHNKTPTVWLFSPDGQLIELIQKQKNKIGLERFTK